MATGTQPQTAWAPWTRDFAEMLEIRLPEVKHQGELKHQHSEPLAGEGFSMSRFTKRMRSPKLPPLRPLPSWRPTGTHDLHSAGPAPFRRSRPMLQRPLDCLKDRPPPASPGTPPTCHPP
jgi:hypothetical protein